MFTLAEINEIRKIYQIDEQGNIIFNRLGNKNNQRNAELPSELSDEDASRIKAAIYLRQKIKDKNGTITFKTGFEQLTEEEFLEKIQSEFIQEALQKREYTHLLMSNLGLGKDAIWADLVLENPLAMNYFSYALSENGKVPDKVQVIGGSTGGKTIKYELKDKSRNPFVASLNPNNSQYTQSATEVQLSADVAAKKRAFVDRLITYYDMMEHDDWYEKRLANEDKNMQKIANIVNHNGQVAPVENIGSLVRMLKAAKNLSIDGEKDYLEAIISQPEVHKALVAAKQEKKYDKIKEEALRCEHEGKVTTQGLREGHQLSQGEKELCSANNLVEKNPNAVAEARATLASKSHISLGTTTDDIKLSNLYCLVARTQGKIPSKQRTYDTIEFDSGTEQGR